MKDLNSVNKYICNSCNKEIDFIWSSGINNSNTQARLCYECKLEIIENAYKN